MWARLFAPPSSDTDFVAQDAIAWLLLEVKGAQEGPDGGNTLTVAKFIQRVNTQGGLAPSTGCSTSAEVGQTAFRPYAADYFFFAKPEDLE